MGAASHPNTMHLTGRAGRAKCTDEVRGKEHTASQSQSCLYLLHVEMMVFKVYWAKEKILFKLIAPALLTFFTLASRTFEITCLCGLCSISVAGAAMSNISTFAVRDLKPEQASRGALPLGHSPQGPGRGEQEEAERPREVGGLVQGYTAVRALPPQAQSTRAPLATPPPCRRVALLCAPEKGSFPRLSPDACWQREVTSLGPVSVNWRTGTSLICSGLARGLGGACSRAWGLGDCLPLGLSLREPPLSPQLHHGGTIDLKVGGPSSRQAACPPSTGCTVCWLPPHSAKEPT